MPELMSTCGVVVAMSRNGWMNEELTNDWLKQVWASLSFRRRLLVWDAYKCHIMNTVRSYVDKQISDINVIPGGLTSHLQPAGQLEHALQDSIQDQVRVDGNWGDIVHGRWKYPCS